MAPTSGAPASLRLSPARASGGVCTLQLAVGHPYLAWRSWHVGTSCVSRSRGHGILQAWYLEAAAAVYYHNCHVPPAFTGRWCQIHGWIACCPRHVVQTPSAAQPVPLGCSRLCGDLLCSPAAQLATGRGHLRRVPVCLSCNTRPSEQADTRPAELSLPHRGAVQINVPWTSKRG